MPEMLGGNRDENRPGKERLYRYVFRGEILFVLLEKCVAREKRRTFVCVHATCRVASLLFARRAFLMSFRVLTLVLSLFNLTRRAYENS